MDRLDKLTKQQRRNIISEADSLVVEQYNNGALMYQDYHDNLNSTIKWLLNKYNIQ